MSRVCVITIAIAAVLSGVAYARRQDPVQTAPTGLALAIIFLKGQPPSLFPVAGPQAKPSGGWSARFGKIAGWKLPDGMLPVRAVQVVSRLEGGRAKVRVSVLTGQQMIEREEKVAVFEIDEGQKVEVAELTRYGVEPIEIKVLSVGPHVTALPEIINKARSVVVTGIAARNSTLPSYHLSLRNTSDKSVAALAVEIMVGGKKEIIMMPQGDEGRTLISGGEWYELAIPAYYQIRPAYGDHPPDFSKDHDCVIRAAVFGDGSFEGDPEPAAQFRALVRGRKIQLRRVVALLQEAIDSKDDDLLRLQRLRVGIEGLNTDVGGDEAQALLEEFPDLPVISKASLNSAIKSTLGFVKKSAREEVDGFEKARSAAPDAARDKAAFQSWLLAAKEKYAGWLSRL